MIYTVFLVVGAAHGGTTIATMLLGQHPVVFATGELTSFPDGRQFAAGNICACGAEEAEWNFWEEIRKDRNAGIGGGPVPILDVYRSILRRTGTRAVVDCNHGPTRPALLARLCRDAPDLQLIVVSVPRPPHSVAGSQLRVALERKRIDDEWRARSRTVADVVIGRERIRKAIDSRKLGCRVVPVEYAALCERPLEIRQ